MTDKELHKLRREDLLQILINQQKQIDDLTAALEESEKALADKRIAIGESGSIAEAALKLNGVFSSAQAAADHYLEETRARADALRQEAEQAAAEARKSADELIRQAKRDADRTLSEARREGERITADAQRQVDEAVRAATSKLAPPPAEESDGAKRRRGLFRRS